MTSNSTDDSQVVQAPMQIPGPVEFFLSTPLYERILYSDAQVWEILDILYYRGTYDCFCVECGREATFQSNQNTRPKEYTRNVRHEELSKSVGADVELPKLKVGSNSLSARCTRNGFHMQEFIFRVGTDGDKRTFQKIGQFPSYADIHIGEVKNYASVLTKSQRHELSKAIGLSSHGVGIGSFVYLRRIFEALVEEAHKTATGDAGWDEVAYSRCRMAEKILALRSHLPEFMSKNTVIYSVLSKGVHELSEGECLQYFDAVRLSIEMILDEKLELTKKAEKMRQAQAAIQLVASQTT